MFERNEQKKVNNYMTNRGLFNIICLITFLIKINKFSIDDAGMKEISKWVVKICHDKVHQTKPGRV